MATKATAYRQMGGSLDYVNSTDATIEAFTVIPFGDRVGIAGEDILPGRLGSIEVTGVFAMPKATGAITAGAQVYLDADGKITAAASVPAATEGGSATANVRAGFAIAAAKADDAEVLVKLNG